MSHSYVFFVSIRLLHFSMLLTFYYQVIHCPIHIVHIAEALVGTALLNVMV